MNSFRGKKYHVIRMIHFGLLCLLLNGCALGGGGQNFAKECRLGANQGGTLVARWPAKPIPISFAEGEFTQQEMSKMASAFDTWNNFYTKVRGEKLFEFGSVSSPNVEAGPKPTVTCANSIVSNGAYTGSVRIFKVVSGWTLDDEIIALTSFCPQNVGGRLEEIYMGMMEFNYENFFNAGQKLPDLRTVTTHEAGHLLGMGHSCEVLGTPGIPSCEEPGLDPDIIQALLFPIIFFPNGVNGEVRPNLEQNDQERSLCLWDEEFNAEGQ